MKIKNLTANDLSQISNNLKRYGSVGDFPNDQDGIIKEEINQLLKLEPSVIAGRLMELLAEQKRYLFEVKHDQLELVWSGPEVPGLYNRDTMVVVDELFRIAKKTIYISGYNFYDGKKIFKNIFTNLSSNPELEVKMFFNIKKKHDHEDPEVVIERFKRSFRQYNWDSAQLPSFYFDPRSLHIDSATKAVLHAKTIIIDDAKAFITSANFTDKAQKENIEAGTLVSNEHFAKKLRNHFDSIVEAGFLTKLEF